LIFWFLILVLYFVKYYFYFKDVLGCATNVQRETEYNPNFNANLATQQDTVKSIHNVLCIQRYSY